MRNARQRKVQELMHLEVHKTKRQSMAIGRLSMKVGKAGKASAHAAYIAREGQYEKMLEKGEKLENKEAGNMPKWAKQNPQEFWKSADAFERVNGTTYREMEIALPRELSQEQRAELVREWVKQEIGDKHAYQWAIHNPKAADDKEQPHVHLMFSERQVDGIDRDPEQYFKRYNAKNPDKGGARKGYGDHAGEKLSIAERAEDLKIIRSRWEIMCNEHLKRAGHKQRIDMRSYAERGIRRAPEIKQLPSQWKGKGKDQILELRAARKESAKAQIELKAVLQEAAQRKEQQEAQRQKQVQEPVRQAEINHAMRLMHEATAKQFKEQGRSYTSDAMQKIDKSGRNFFEKNPMAARQTIERYEAQQRQERKPISQAERFQQEIAQRQERRAQGISQPKKPPQQEQGQDYMR